MQVRGSHHLGQRVYALEPVAMVRHRLARTPQVVERERRVLAAAVARDGGAIRGLEIPIGEDSACAQRLTHFLDGGAVHVGDSLHPVVATVAAHERTPVRQLGHRSYGEPPAPVEEQPLLVRQLLEDSRVVAGDAAVKHQIVTPRDDHQRIELQVLARDHGGLRPALACPATTGPEALFAEDEPACGLHGDLNRVGHAGENLASVSVLVTLEGRPD